MYKRQGEDTQNGGITTLCKGLINCHDGYTDSFHGTNAASAMVTGVVALMLEANSELTWRDIKYILAKTAVQNDEYDTRWIQNSAGYKFNNAYGFGALNANTAVDMAKVYKKNTLGQIYKVEPSHNDSETKSIIQLKAADGVRIEAVRIKIKLNLNLEARSSEKIFIAREAIGDEQLVSFENSTTSCHNTEGIILDICDPNVSKVAINNYLLSDLTFHLESPNKTQSIFISPYAIEKLTDENELEFSTNAFFGELAEGEWTIKLSYGKHFFHGIDILLEDVDLQVYGTKTDISKNTNP